MAELINRSYELYLKGKQRKKDARKGGLEAFSNLYKEITDFDELDDEYYKLNEQTMKTLRITFVKIQMNFALEEDGNEFDMSFVGELKKHCIPKTNQKQLFQFPMALFQAIYKSYYENGKPKRNNWILKWRTSNRKNWISRKREQEIFNLKIRQSKGLLAFTFLRKMEIWNQQKSMFLKYDRDGKWIQYYANGQMKKRNGIYSKGIFVQNCWKEDGTQIMKDGTGLYINEYSIFDGVIDRNEQEYRNYKRHGKQYSYSNKVNWNCTKKWLMEKNMEWQSHMTKMGTLRKKLFWKWKGNIKKEKLSNNESTTANSTYPKVAVQWI